MRETGDRRTGGSKGVLRLVLRPALLGRTLLTAAVVGTILSAVNLGHVIAAGDATSGTWLRVATNYVVPFVVANIGAVAASRDR